MLPLKHKCTSWNIVTQVSRQRPIRTIIITMPRTPIPVHRHPCTCHPRPHGPLMPLHLTLITSTDPGKAAFPCFPPK